jgi:F420H(2)-dependent quinone reductase
MDFNAWNKQVIEEFRANGGVVGGMFEGSPMVIVHTEGAKTGGERRTRIELRPAVDVVVDPSAHKTCFPRHQIVAPYAPFVTSLLQE